MRAGRATVYEPIQPKGIDMRRFLGAVFAAALVAGCQHETTVNLFTADLVAAADGVPDLQATASLLVNTGSKAACNQHSAVIAAALAKGFSAPEFLGCTDKGFEVFAEYRVRLDLRPMDSADATALYIGVARRSSLVVAVIQASPGAIDRVTKALPENLRNPYNGPAKIAAQFVIQNDLADAVTVSVSGVFLDGKPIPQQAEVKMDRRDEARIVLSDVGNAALAEGAAPVLTLLP